MATIATATLNAMGLGLLEGNSPDTQERIQ